jgi:uncharacterized protein (DUF1697 family)
MHRGDRMTWYVAWLRGINVGGHKLIAMKDLCGMFESAGFNRVKSFIQSGNVIFEAVDRNPRTIVTTIESTLGASLGYQVTVALRTTAEVEALVKRNPFKGLGDRDDVKLFVTFLAELPCPRPKLPLISPKKDIEVIQIRGRDVFSLSRRVRGRFGFSNSFLEKQLGVAATTRGWPTVTRIVASAHADAGD